MPYDDGGDGDGGDGGDCGDVGDGGDGGDDGDGGTDLWSQGDSPLVVTTRHLTNEIAASVAKSWHIVIIFTINASLQ